jgi:hypothetical protein
MLVCLLVSFLSIEVINIQSHSQSAGQNNPKGDFQIHMFTVVFIKVCNFVQSRKVSRRDKIIRGVNFKVSNVIFVY